MSTSVIIEAAINGGTTKEVNPHVPVAAEEIAADALAALDAGAAVVHAHCGGLRGGDAAQLAQKYLDAFGPVWAQRPGALLYPTINYERGGADPTHLVLLADHGLRIGPMDPGSVNLRRRRRGRRPGRSLRVRQLLRVHREEHRGARRAPPGHEHRDLRARLPAGRPGLRARRTDLGRLDGEV